jgi:hypothetical protein
MPQHMSCDNGSVGDGSCPTRFTELRRMTRSGQRCWNTANHLRWDRCSGSTRRRRWTSQPWLPGVAPTHAPPRDKLTKSESPTLQIGRRDEGPTRSRPIRVLTIATASHRLSVGTGSHEGRAECADPIRRWGQPHETFHAGTPSRPRKVATKSKVASRIRLWRIICLLLCVA